MRPRLRILEIKETPELHRAWGNAVEAIVTCTIDGALVEPLVAHRSADGQLHVSPLDRLCISGNPAVFILDPRERGLRFHSPHMPRNLRALLRHQLERLVIDYGDCAPLVPKLPRGDAQP